MAIEHPRQPGDMCPKCGRPVQSLKDMFAFRGQMFPGLVCCGSLWVDASQETIFDAAKQAAMSEETNG
jgi:hypothetical protein